MPEEVMMPIFSALPASELEELESELEELELEELEPQPASPNRVMAAVLEAIPKKPRREI
jgi:hypothetical protein